MFDIGWSEILVIATVAVVVVGPKDLPRMLRTFGKTMGQVRRTANDFKRQFDDALREAEREAGLEETRKQVQSIAKANPLADVKKDFDDSMRGSTAAASKKPDAKPTEPATAQVAAAATPAPAAQPAPSGSSPAAAPEPAKPAEPRPAEGSDAA